MCAMSFLECVFMYIEYDIYNDTGRRSVVFVVFNIFLSVIRNTSARVLTLLVALGYGITKPTVEKYYSAIGILGFLHFVANAAYTSAIYLNHYAPLSKALLIVVSVPISITNTLFFYWIIYSLRYNLNLLSERQQRIKYLILSKFTYSLAIVLGIAVFFVGVEIVAKFMMDRDYMWQYLWLLDAIWIMIFSAFLFWVMLIMRPNTYSKMLAYHEELQEETMSDHHRQESLELSVRHSVPMPDPSPSGRDSPKNIAPQSLTLNQHPRDDE